jgi:hypothetical protein
MTLSAICDRRTAANTFVIRSTAKVLLKRPDTRWADNNVITRWRSVPCSTIGLATRRRNRNAAEHGAGYMCLGLNFLPVTMRGPRSRCVGNNHRENECHQQDFHVHAALQRPNFHFAPIATVGEPAALQRNLHGPQVWSTMRSGDHRGF